MVGGKVGGVGSHNSMEFIFRREVRRLREGEQPRNAQPEIAAMRFDGDEQEESDR